VTVHDNLTLRAAMSFAPASLDEKTRTVELIASTGAGVVRHDLDGPFMECLEITEAAVDTSRTDGMPVLDTHMQGSLDKQLGVVRGIRFEPGKLIVSVEISERAEAIWKDIKAGIIRNVSVGYVPMKWSDRDGPEGRVRTVTRWVLHEVSLVPVPADPNAKVRNMTTTTADPPATMTRAQHNAEIRGLASTFNLGNAWADPLIDGEASAQEARAAALDEMKKRAARPTPTVTVVADHSGDHGAITRNVADAVFVSRVNPGAEMPAAARPYAGMTMLDISRDALARAGISTVGLSPADTVTRALHSTSDFPAILGGVGERTLRAAYEAAPAALKAVAKQTTAKDFKAKTSLQLGEAPVLERVNESGEFKYGTMAEGKEAYRLDTFGKIIGLTRQAIINDDLHAFTALANSFGFGSAEFEAQFLVDLLVKASGNGPTMDDGKALFHSDHNNKAASGAALDATSLGAARLAMRRQKGLSGRPINVTPKFLLVPPELETTAEKLLATINPTSTADVNVFGGKLQLLVEARLASPTRWYVVADPTTVPGLEYAYLQGHEGPQTETRHGFEVDGVEVKVRLDFGAGFLDHRGWYVNAGA
jgi:HK97 family phage prohead protease